MDVVLTDDEIVAVALERHLAWPVPFPTVATDIDHLAAAAARGRRSLIVRGLAIPTNSGVVVSADLIDTMEQAASSRCVMAWVASIEASAVLAGSSTAIYRRPSGDLIDLTSAIGIHDIRAVSTGDADAIVVALAKNVFDFGFAGPANPAIRLLIGEFGGRSLVMVSEREVQFGSWTANGFEIGLESTGWDPRLIEEAMQ